MPLSEYTNDATKRRLLEAQHDADDMSQHCAPPKKVKKGKTDSGAHILRNHILLSQSHE